LLYMHWYISFLWDVSKNSNGSVPDYNGPSSFINWFMQRLTKVTKFECTMVICIWKKKGNATET
jgi:hypothetical protein